MKVLLYADFRSPHAQGWRAGLVEAGIQVVAVSSEICGLDGVIEPADRTSQLRSTLVERSKRQESDLPARVRRKVSRLQMAHSVIELTRHKSRLQILRDQVKKHDPDLVHALRLPYEGITALAAIRDRPVIVSTWGQDFEPQADKDILLRTWYRRLLPRAAGLVADAPEDVQRALRYRLSDNVPTIVAAGNFGVDTSLFHSSTKREPPVVVYPRKLTPNNNYWGFLEATAKVKSTASPIFVGIGLLGLQAQAAARFGQAWASGVILTDVLSRDELAGYLRSAKVVVSPSYSDGMPNSVLEALSCGARVVAGHLPQLVQLQALGLPIELVDATDSQALATAISKALNAPALSGTQNLPIEYTILGNLVAIPAFYHEVLS